MSTLQSEFEGKFGTYTDCTLLQRLLIDFRAEEILARKEELTSLNFSHTCYAEAYPIFGEKVIVIQCQDLKIEFGPPPADFGSVCSPQKARKFRYMQQTT